MAEERVRRRLAAIMAADVVGYSRLMGEDESGTLAALNRHRTEFIHPTVSKYGGRIVKLMGDGALVEFPSVVDAVECAVAVQRGMLERNAEMPEDRRITYRIGINLGDIIIEGDDIYGDGVNVAARLEAEAEPGCLCLSGDAYRQVQGKTDLNFEDLGELSLKNIAEPVRAYKWSCGDAFKSARAEAGADSVLKDDQQAQAGSILSLPDKPSIIILPFQNITGDPEQDFLAEGLRMDIQNALVKVSGIFLIALNCGNAYRGKSAEEATDRFKVRYAFEGNVRKSGNRIRISTTLTDAIQGEIVWAEQFDRKLDDAFELTDDIIGRILTALNVKLVAGEQAKVWHKTLPDLRSLEAFYRGVHRFFHMTDKSSLGDARRQFELVARLHPESAMGPTWIALTYWYEFQRGWSKSREESKRLAKEWAEKGAALTDTDGQAQTVLCHVHLLDRDFDAALQAGEATYESRLNCVHSNAFYANALHYCGEHEKALQHIELATRYAPIHPPLYDNFHAAICRATGDLEGASKAAQTVIEANPKDIPARLVLTSIAIKQGRPDEAAQIAREVHNLEPEFSVAKFAAGQPYRSEDFLTEYVTELCAAGLPK